MSSVLTATGATPASMAPRKTTGQSAQSCIRMSDALLALDAPLLERSGEPSDTLVEFPVGHHADVVDERRLGGALGIGLKQMRREVERLRRRFNGAHGHRRLPRAEGRHRRLAHLGLMQYYAYCRLRGGLEPCQTRRRLRPLRPVLPPLGPRGRARPPISPAGAAETEAAKEPFLAALGERAKALRTRRGLTRKALARATGVSERHLANLEYGVGNASILVLLQVAQALQCSLAELVGDVTTQSPEWLLMREMLADRDEATLRRVRLAALELMGGASPPHQRDARPLVADCADRPARRGQINAGPHAGGGSRLSVRRAQPRD